MTRPTPIPERSPAERALKAFVAYLGTHRAEPGTFPVALGGEFARQVDERDFGTNTPTGIARPLTRASIVTQAPNPSARLHDDLHRVELEINSSMMPGATPQQREHYEQSMVDQLAGGSLSSGWEIADRALLELARLEIRVVDIELDGADSSVPILTERGRFLEAVARFDDATVAWTEYAALAGRTSGYERAAMETVRDFRAAIAPVMLSARRNPNRFTGEMQALGRNYPELFGDARPTRSVDMLMRHKVAAFLTVPERLADPLARDISMQPTSADLGRVSVHHYHHATTTIGVALNARETSRVMR